MSRSDTRKPALKMEDLEARNLQSALATNPPVNAPPVVLGGNAHSLTIDLGQHNYHGVTGFFGQ